MRLILERSFRLLTNLLISWSLDATLKFAWTSWIQLSICLPSTWWLIFFRGIGAVVYRVPELETDLKLKVSLRSIRDEDTTSISQVILFRTSIFFLTYNMQIEANHSICSNFMQNYGGGGHRNASSFLLDYSEFQRWKVSVNNSI